MRWLSGQVLFSVFVHRIKGKIEKYPYKRQLYWCLVFFSPDKYVVIKRDKYQAKSFAFFMNASLLELHIPMQLPSCLLYPDKDLLSNEDNIVFP